MSALPKDFVPDETDLIEQQLDESLDAFAPLSARHEPNGREGSIWGHRRKILFSEIREAIRADFERRGARITADRLEDLARCSPQYRQYIDDGEAERIEFFRQKNLRIEHYIRRRELDKRGMR